MINHLTGQRPVTEENSTQTQEMREWTQAMTNLINFLEPATGTGSPEGVVSAKAGKEYWDDAGTIGAINWRKRDDDIAGDDSLGWILS